VAVLSKECSNSIPGITQKDIVYKTSTDDGASWGDEIILQNIKALMIITV